MNQRPKLGILGIHYSLT